MTADDVRTDHGSAVNQKFSLSVWDRISQSHSSRAVRGAVADRVLGMLLHGWDDLNGEEAGSLPVVTRAQ